MLCFVNSPMKTEIYEDVVNFIVDKLPPDEVISFRPSPNAQQRFEALSQAIKSGEATSDERAEMEECLRLEHLMQLAKARARAKVAGQTPATATR